LQFINVSSFIFRATHFQCAMPEHPEKPPVLPLDTSRVQNSIPFNGSLDAFSAVQLPVRSSPPLYRERCCLVWTYITATDGATRPSNYSSLLDRQVCYRY